MAFLFVLPYSDHLMDLDWWHGALSVWSPQFDGDFLLVLYSLD